METKSEKREPIFEDIFGLIGQIGVTQVSMYLFACVIETCVSISVVFYAFEYAVPGWTCAEVTNSTDNATAISGTANLSYPWTADNVSANVCPASGNPCINLTYSDEYTSISTEWNLICDRRYLGRLTASLYFVGVLVGSCLGGQLSDTFGRKRTILAMWLGLILFQTCTGFATSWAVYLPLRIIAGIFAGGGATVALILPVEYLGPKYRILTSNRFGWQIGGMIVALIGYLTREWQKMAIGGGLLTLPFVPFFAFFMPESARWLIQKGKVKEAGQWIERIAKYNRRPPPDLSILDKIAEAENAKKHMLEKYTYLDLFRTRKYAMRSSVLILGWFDISLLAYGIGADMESLTGNIYLNMVLFCVAMISLRWTAIPIANKFDISLLSYGIGADMESFTGSIYLNMFLLCVATVALRWTAIPIANKIGRRKTYLIAKLGVLACLLVVMSLAITDHDRFGPVITGVVISSCTLQAIVWCIVFIYCSEAYPTLLRTRATALGNMSSRIGGILAPQVGLLSKYHKSGPYVLYLVVGVVSLVLFYGIMPETNGQPLPEDLPPRTLGDREPEKENGLRQPEEVEMLKVNTDSA